MGRAKASQLNRGFISRNGRKVRFFATRYIERPFLHLREGEAISFAEKQVDLTLSRVMRRFLSMTGLESRTACTPYGLFHYYDSAPHATDVPLVLLHGAGSSGQCFSLIAEAVKAKRRVILPDLFHFSGFSQPNNAVMTVEEHVDSVVALLDEAGIKLCDFVGLSLGGWIGLRLSAEHPERVRRLMLLNPAGLRFGSIVLRDKLTTLSWEKFQHFFPGVLYARPFNGVRGVTPVVRRSIYRLLKDHAVRDFVKSVRPADFVEPLLSKVHCPVRVLWGERDAFLSYKTPTYLLRHLYQVEGFYVENAAHVLCLEAPTNVLRHMNDFFALGLAQDSGFAKALERLFPEQPERPIASTLSASIHFPPAQGWRQSV